MSDFNFNEQCEKLLARYNNRNAEHVTKRLDVICDSLRRKGYRTVQTKLGGSVKKGTYVSGLSDADILLFVNQTPLANQSPSKVIKHVKQVIKNRMPNNEVRAGKLAVTVNYSNGMEIQLLPALRTKSGGYRIAEFGSTKWSNIVVPDNFAERLTRINVAKGSRVLPIIKLTKALADCSITNQGHKISGYHMESLAVNAFSDYSGPSDTRSMLIYFLRHSVRAVLTPIPDPTGQTNFADQSLGEANSRARKVASTHFGQMRSNVESCNTPEKFNELFCIGN